jgi:hypothetical protein
MGQYNPHAPYILGQEWVPIRNAHYQSDGVTERGYTFRIDHTTLPVSGAFYVTETPDRRIAQSCDVISVYPAGREALTGPIKSVKIRPSSIVVNNPGSIDITEGVQALYSPEDSRTIIFDADTGISSQLNVTFDTEQYAQILLNKRIVDVRLNYVLRSPNVGNSELLDWRIHNQSAFKGWSFPDVTEVFSTSEMGRISTLSITELNPGWDSTALFRTQRTVLPWRFQELNRFRSGEPAASALVVFMQNTAEVSFVLLEFLEMEVLYCEETRVLYGGFRTYDNNFVNFPQFVEELYNVGAIAARLYNPATFAQGNTLTPGDYTVTVYHRDMASKSIRQGTPEINAVRSYYELPHQRSVRVNQTMVLGDTFTKQTNADVLTHLTLHTATTIVTGVHAYGTSEGAPVYGSRTAIQEIEDNPSGGTGVQYPQVRFYARRLGSTTVPLTLTDVATGTSTVSISVADFDALPEIVDGWREVTLRFTTPPTFPVTADDVDWRWSATGELTGNQWQVMVASGPTGAWGPTPAAAATGPATYWAPFGSNVALTWQSPTISGAAQDTTSDAVLIFSQDPPTVTGFSVTQDAQELAVALECSTTPACIPTGIGYNALTWTPFGVCATFGEDDTGGWPDADTGQSFASSGGTIATDYSAENGQGIHTLGTVSVARNSTATTANPVLSLTTVKVDIASAQLATGDTISAGPGIGTDGNTMYHPRLQFITSGTLSMELVKRVAAVQTSLASATVGGYVPNQMWTVELIWRIGGYIEVRAWPAGTTRPNSPQITYIDTSITSFPAIIMRSVLGGGNTNVNPMILYDNIVATHAPLHDGSLEIQRRDAYDVDWQTIMLTHSPGCVISFNDLEARVGILTEYRMRTLNALDFAGAWVTGSGTIPSPGAYGVGNANSVLIFTTNADIDATLAYVMQWNGTPVEEFFFPEADTVTLQRMFDRDYIIATHPLERGGERFSRMILVNAAAISLPSLANFRELRDLAWTDYDYLCVRDELGNRWFATIIVPQAEIRGDRTKYLARVEVIEATDTPSPIDPE